MCEKIKVLLVEDDLDFAFLIQKLIKSEEKICYSGHEASREAGVDRALKVRPDIVIMDINLSGCAMDGIEAAKEIRLKTNAKIILLTSYEKPEIIINASTKAFASGYVLKSQCQTLTDIICKTALSHTPQELFIKELLLSRLSSAERGVLDDLICGHTENLASASLKTIANQKTSIFKKLGLKNTNEVLRIFKNW